ncbi:MAG: hypothetical protein IKW02_02385 [Clostridia bacterium]|nr:hypothetical protein [Clostridia bacterium]
MIKLTNRTTPRLLPYIFVLAFISGVSVGSLVARFSASGNVVSATSGEALYVFTRSFSAFIKPCLLIWFFGFSRFSEYISSGVIAYRGALFGFVNTCIFSKLGFFDGFVPSIAASLPHNLVFFPFLIFLSLSAARKTKKPFGYILILALAIVICSLSALTDTYITAFFIRLLL